MNIFIENTKKYKFNYKTLDIMHIYLFWKKKKKNMHYKSQLFFFFIRTNIPIRFKIRKLA